MTEPLRVAGISKSFGSLRVLDGLSFCLREREVLGLIGPNGAGKSLLFSLIAGDLKPDAGSVTFAGEDVTGLESAARCRRGIARTYQIPRPFQSMTVYENVLVGAAFGAKHSEAEAREPARRALELTGMLSKSNQVAGSLPLMDRKRLELARSLATSPKLLLLDEIAGGLSDPEVEDLITTIRRIHEAGTCIIWVEHIVHALVSTVGRLLVINSGAVLAEGEPLEVMADSRVRESYLGMIDTPLN